MRQRVTEPSKNTQLTTHLPILLILWLKWRSIEGLGNAKSFKTFSFRILRWLTKLLVGLLLADCRLPVKDDSVKSSFGKKIHITELIILYWACGKGLRFEARAQRLHIWIEQDLLDLSWLEICLRKPNTRLFRRARMIISQHTCYNECRTTGSWLPLRTLFEPKKKQRQKETSDIKPETIKNYTWAEQSIEK